MGPGRSGVSQAEFARRAAKELPANCVERATTHDRTQRDFGVDRSTRSPGASSKPNESDAAPGTRHRTASRKPTPLLRYGWPATLTGTALYVVVPVPSWP